jgi:hypothetical protein
VFGGSGGVVRTPGANSGAVRLAGAPSRPLSHLQSMDAKWLSWRLDGHYSSLGCKLLLLQGSD